MTEQYEKDIIDQKLGTLEIIISRLQEGLASSYEWAKDEVDTRAQELAVFVSQRDALTEKRNTLEQAQELNKQDTIQRYKDAKWTQGDTMADYDLTAEDKIAVINSHIKNINYNKFNAELVIVEENASASPSASRIAEANATITQAEEQVTALLDQIDFISSRPTS